MWCPNCERLEAELAEVKEKLEASQAASSEATDLMMKGESLRHNMMVNAIFNGAYGTPEGAKK